ncbi:MAG: hypothetical protein Q9214_006254 [Letrouitia sp. 1 TL-2023]
MKLGLCAAAHFSSNRITDAEPRRRTRWRGKRARKRKAGKVHPYCLQTTHSTYTSAIPTTFDSMSDPYNNPYPNQYYGQTPPPPNYDPGFAPPARQNSFGPPQHGGFQHGQSGAQFGGYDASNPQGQPGYYNYGSGPQYPPQQPQYPPYQQQQQPPFHDPNAPYQPPQPQQGYSMQSSDPNAPNYDPNAPPAAEGERGLGGAIAGGLAGHFAGNRMGNHGLLGTIGGAILGSKLQDKYKDKPHHGKHHSSHHGGSQWGGSSYGGKW